jgi:hypothetical protein
MTSLPIRSITPPPYAEVDYAKEDLSRFVEYTIPMVGTIVLGNNDLTRHIRETIFSKAQGRLLWADLMLKILKYQHTEADIRDSLNTAPSDLGALITQVLQAYRTNIHAERVEERITYFYGCPTQPAH